MERTADLGVFERRNSAATAQGKQQKVKPGEWKSKRAEDEAQRAMEFVVDRDFSLSESPFPVQPHLYLGFCFWCWGVGRGLMLDGG